MRTLASLASRFKHLLLRKIMFGKLEKDRQKIGKSLQQRL